MFSYDYSAYVTITKVLSHLAHWFPDYARNRGALGNRRPKDIEPESDDVAEFYSTLVIPTTDDEK